MSWWGEKTAAVSLIAGFFGGLALGWIFSSSVFVSNSVKVVPNAFDFEKEQHIDEDKTDPDSADSDEEYKLVLVVRNDAEMNLGKIAAQCSHATLACFQKACEKTPHAVDTWFSSGQAKVVCKCKSDDDLENLRSQAKRNGLPTCLICDAGKTKVDGGRKTVLGIGPAPSKLIDGIVRQLTIY